MAKRSEVAKLTKVRITGRDAVGNEKPGGGLNIEIEVNAVPAEAVNHPEVRKMESALQKRYKTVNIEVIQ